MKELIKQIKKDMKSLNLSPETITQFIDRINELKSSSSSITDRICEDDSQVLKLSRVLISKCLEGNHIRIIGNEWEEENLTFSLIKFWIDDLELNRIITTKLYELGGHAYFEVVKKRDFLNFIYDEINNVINNLQNQYNGAKEDYAKSQVNDIVDLRSEKEVMGTLKQFKEVIERDCWKAFWENGSTKNKLKNYPEDIGKSQFMTFLKGHGIKFKKLSKTFQEIPEGAGFCDVIYMDHRGNTFVFELKVWRGKSYFQIGINELNNHLSKENENEGYYIVFDTRKRLKKTIKTPIKTNGKLIHIIQIDIAPNPPTSNS